MRTPSLSGDEGEAAAVLAGWAARHGIPVRVDDAAVRIEIAAKTPGPTLLLASHLDTVPAGDGWTRGPHGAEIEDGFLWGRGAVDAKGSVAAMAGAVASCAPAKGRLVLLATYREETLLTSMPKALERLGPVDAAIVGEPTGNAPCVAQRGLVVLRLTWRGRARHAGWAAEERGLRENAIEDAARDVDALARLTFDREHPVLGKVSLAPTRIEGGTASNVIPDRCEATFDVRTTPRYTPDEIAEAVRRTVTAEVEVKSARCLPCETPEGSPLLAAILRASPGARAFGSPTSSDWVSMREVDAVKLGPGDSRLSHTSEERIRIDEVGEAARLYAAIAKEYLG